MALSEPTTKGVRRAWFWLLAGKIGCSLTIWAEVKRSLRRARGLGSWEQSRGLEPAVGSKLGFDCIEFVLPQVVAAWTYANTRDAAYEAVRSVMESSD